MRGERKKRDKRRWGKGGTTRNLTPEVRLTWRVPKVALHTVATDYRKRISSKHKSRQHDLTDPMLTVLFPGTESLKRSMVSLSLILTLPCKETPNSFNATTMAVITNAFRRLYRTRWEVLLELRLCFLKATSPAFCCS